LFGKTEEARRTTDQIRTIFEQKTRDPRELKSEHVPIAAAVAFARVQDQDGIKRALKAPAPRTPQDQRTVLNEVFRVQADLGDEGGLLQTVDSLPDADRLPAMFWLMQFSAERGDPKVFSADFYRQILERLPKPRSSDAPINPAHVAEMQAGSAMDGAIIGLCSHGKYDDATAFVIGLPATHTGRAGWLSSICVLRAQAGDVEGAIASAQRGGYLTLTARFQRDAGKFEEAARNLRIVSLALEGDPPKDAQGANQRLGLLRAIALMQFRANQPAEGRRTVSKALNLAATMNALPAAQNPQFQFASDRAAADLSSLEIEAAILGVDAGNLAGAIATAEKHAGLPGTEDALARFWARIATVQWGAGDQSSARTSFQKAVIAGGALMGGQKVIMCDLTRIAMARVRVGDLNGGYETLMPPRNGAVGMFPFLPGGAVEDGLIEVAEAFVRAKDAKKAREIMNAYRYVFEFGANRQGVFARAIEQVALVHARADLDAAFALWYPKDGNNPLQQDVVPKSLLQVALGQGRFDLALPRLQIQDHELLPLHQLLEPLTQARKPEDAQPLLEKVLDRCIEIGAGAQDVDLASSCLVLFELMARDGLPERIKGLVSRVKRPTHPAHLTSYVYMHLKYGDVSEALAASRLVLQGWKGNTLQDAIGALAEGIAPGTPGGERLFPWVTGFPVERPVIKPGPVQVALNREMHNPNAQAWPSPSLEPPLTPEAVRALTAKLAEAGPAAKEVDPQRWSVVTLYDGVGGRLRDMQESGAAVLVNGQPTIFTVVSNPQKNFDRRGIVLRPKGQLATSEFLDRSKEEPAQLAVDAVAVGDRVYLAVSSVGLNRIATTEIRSLVDGKWEVEHVGPFPLGSVGGGVRLAVVRGQPVGFSLGAGWKARFLQRKSDGKWLEAEEDLPANPDPAGRPPGRQSPLLGGFGAVSSSISVLDDGPIVAFGYHSVNERGLASQGIYFGRREGNGWDFTKVDNPPWACHHVGVLSRDGKPIVVAANDSGLLIYAQKGEKWEPQPSPLPKNVRLDSVCVGTIAGKATILASEAGKLHLLTAKGSGWADQIVPNTASYLTALTLFEWQGKPAIVALAPSRNNVWDLQYVVLLRPPGAGGDQ
jgi:hypothetical protein